MKVERKQLQKALKDFPRHTSNNLEAAIIKSVNEALGLAKVMVPRDTGDLASGIHAKFESGDGVFKGSVEAAEAKKDPQEKARAVEFGRRYHEGPYEHPYRGITGPAPYIQRAQEIVNEKHRGRITRAINKAKKQTGFK